MWGMLALGCRGIGIVVGVGVETGMERRKPVAAPVNGIGMRMVAPEGMAEACALANRMARLIPGSLIAVARDGFRRSNPCKATGHTETG